MVWNFPEQREYPPFILDGASGSGKTQQAFALLKSTGKLIYVNLGDETAQPIYEQMGLAVGDAGFRKFDECVKECLTVAKSDEIEEPGDIHTIRSLRASENLNGMISWFQRSMFRYDASGVGPRLSVGAGMSLSVGAGVTTDIRAGQAGTGLEGCVLFVDEALPVTSDCNDRDRLRFVRNAGRCLNMRVVPAGTAAVVANMIKASRSDTAPSPKSKASSRIIGGPSICWAESHFLEKPMTEDEFNRAYPDAPLSNDEFLKGVLLAERPLVVHLFMKEKKSQAKYGKLLSFQTTLLSVGATLRSQKSLTRKLKVAWLTGMWLQQETTVAAVSPYPVQPPELVKGHFFEPAMAALEDGMPFVGSGIARVRSLPAPLTASIYRIGDKDLEGGSGSEGGEQQWVLKSCVTDDKGEQVKQAAATQRFDDISSALSLCVQQCLVREPLLAIALSTQHRLEPEEFKDGICECLQASPSEYTLGALSGEQLELVTFAALQQANGKGFVGPRKNVVGFCESLIPYLAPRINTDSRNIGEGVLIRFGLDNGILKNRKKTKVEAPKFNGGEEASKSAKALQAKKKNTAEEISVPETSGDPQDVKDLANSILMPWLVPACGRKGKFDGAAASAVESVLRDGVHACGDSPGIAGLVPGSVNALCDINAYTWPDAFKKGSFSPPEWKFEVKGRTENYSMTNGTDDLVKKCHDDEDNGEGRYHAMLIAVRGQLTTQTCMWTVTKGGKKYLRVLVLVAGK